MQPSFSIDPLVSMTVTFACAGLELAKMSAMPSGVLEEASVIASHLTRVKSVNSSLSEGSPTIMKTHKIGRQLVQVARNSLLDADALRRVLFADICIVQCNNWRCTACSIYYAS